MTRIVNPHVAVRLNRENGVITAIKVEAPVKGEGLKVTTIDRTKSANLFSYLVIYSGLRTSDGILSLSVAEQARLMEIGFLIAADQVPEAVFYECDIDATPLDLLPQRARGRSSSAAATLDHLIVDPTLKVLGDDGPPTEMR